MEQQALPLIDKSVIIVYFVAIVSFGTFFSRYSRSTTDYFFGGRRFKWWLIAMSCVATVVGSYSFIKYSQAGYAYGLASSQTYLNDWQWMPIWMLAWLPIIYYSRVKSIPEYFERRFGTAARHLATFIILIYLISYIGINLYTLGKAVEILLGWTLWTSVIVTAVVAGIYVTAGGQTSVIMTDLFQAFLLLVAGFLILLLGVNALGGFEIFWGALPEKYRFGLAHFNRPSGGVNFINVYWQDAFGSSVAFWFMNQGLIMRFLCARSAKDGRRAVILVLLCLMPLAAIAVGNAGLLARAMHETGGELGEQVDGYMYVEKDGERVIDSAAAFTAASRILCIPGVFGFVMAALTAALMSTVDTLVNAVAAISVYDVYQKVLPKKSDWHYLTVARVVSVIALVIGILLVYVFKQFKTIYDAHACFTAAITPPMIVAILMGALWKGFSRKACVAVLGLGIIAMVISIIFPVVIAPFAHGVEQAGEGLQGFKYMRACYGVAVCTVIGFVFSFLYPNKQETEPGLVIGNERDFKRRFKGGEPNERPGRPVRLTVQKRDDTDEGDEILLPVSARTQLDADPSDMLHVSDTRWWLGGLRSSPARLAAQTTDTDTVLVPQALLDAAHLIPGQTVVVEKIF